MRGEAVSTSSLRAQRSNPESLRGKILDCFVASAPRNDEEESFAFLSLTASSSHNPVDASILNCASATIGSWFRASMS
ncbi:hypothetical protein CWO91_21850 [Bradyrhizobium genosp. SA-3]|nr:hypothetical protein CWO91_21850 [Bradyrhizobium genosp. SA-3]